TEGLPAPLRLAGFGLALLSVWLVSRTNSTIYLRELALPVAAGIGFGAFLTLLAFASERAVFWPLVAARVASSSVLIPLALATSSLHAERVRLPLIAVTGLLDAGGNALYALAAQFGRLDIAAVLSSLYPAGTVLLARLILKEDMSRAQWIGLGAALLAIGLITVGG
ncbi:MAG: EamA family transporter, partial [Chloroflexi bacterium]|nr:EamA family transporter [Chloroflexota bacterium]